ncbi:unnamed protein product [Phaeothamnion confervicola]
MLRCCCVVFATATPGVGFISPQAFGLWGGGAPSWAKTAPARGHSTALRAGDDRGAFSAGADPEDVALERKAGELERRLASAVAKEDYVAASAARDEMNRLHMDEVSSVLRVNSNFYEAMTDKDAERMAVLWQRSDLVNCIHPGTKPVQGYDLVMKVYRGMFASRDSRFRKSKVVPANVRVNLRGTSAWVTCTEEIRAPGAPLRQRLCATNIFRKEGGRWFLTHHHASPYPSAGASGVGSGGLAELLASGLGGGGNGGGPRIIALGSGSSDGIDQATVEDIVNSIRGAMAEQGGGSGSQSGLPTGIISFGTGNGGEVGNTFFLEAKSSDGSDGDGDSGSSSDESDDDSEGDDDDDKNVTRRTVAAVRHVCAAGMIADAQKRALLTDIIRHASTEAASAVEIAFELLLAPEGGEGDASADALSEFADQCKYFADQLLEG